MFLMFEISDWDVPCKNLADRQLVYLKKDKTERFDLWHWLTDGLISRDTLIW